jgi:cation diffusion facilitator family transporter
VNSVFLIVGINRSAKPPDKHHPFGYGKAIYFWSLITAIFMLGFVSMGSITRGYRQITEHRALENFQIAIAVLLVSFFLESVAVYFAARGVLSSVKDVKFVSARHLFVGLRQANDPAIKLVFIEDLCSFIGVGIALCAVSLAGYTGNLAIDGYGAIAIGAMLGILAIFLANENREKLLGVSADPIIEKKIHRLVKLDPKIGDVIGLKTMRMGTDKVLVYMTVELEPKMRIEEADDVTAGVEKRIKKEIPEVVDCFIEVIADEDV